VGDDKFLHDEQRVEDFSARHGEAETNVALWLQTTCDSVIRNKLQMKRLKKSRRISDNDGHRNRFAGRAEALSGKTHNLNKSKKRCATC
jgi:hypothetical protein